MTKDQPTQEEKDRIKAMVGRMQQAYNVDKPELSEILGCQINTINNWAHYGRVPYEQLEKCREATNVTMDWLLYGENMPKPVLTTHIVEDLAELLADVVNGAVDYGTISLLLPDASDNMINRLKKELRKRYNVETNGSED